MMRGLGLRRCPCVLGCHDTSLTSSSHDISPAFLRYFNVISPKCPARRAALALSAWRGSDRMGAMQVGQGALAGGDGTCRPTTDDGA